jgi:glycosyltransferase involved in cell wall biosynthesis
MQKKIKGYKPFFTIITVVKNDEKNILKTVKSVLKQTYRNFEYLVIDGKSTDNTLKKIKKIKKISKIISEKDQGIYDAMNKGIKLSSGNVIVFINSGDTFTPNALKYVKKEFDIKKDINFVFGTVERHYTKKIILKHGYNVKRILFNFDFATSHSTGFFLRKQAYKKIGPYDKNFRCSADYDFYFRMLKKNMKGSSTKKIELVGKVASGGYSSSLSFIDHIIEETKIRIKNRQNIVIIIIILFNAILKNIIRQMITK